MVRPAIADLLRRDCPDWRSRCYLFLLWIGASSLYAKMDLLLSHQWQRLLEIQEIQVEMMEELVARERKPSDEPAP